MSDKQQAASSASIYRDPQPLSADRHGTWRLRRFDLSFARDSYFCPTVVSEFRQASRWYPIVFSLPDTMPVCVLGVEKRNLFVRDGSWIERAYVPAYFRRYPFATLRDEQNDKVLLAIDAACNGLVGEDGDGAALFEQGALAPAAKDALRFCELFASESLLTKQFAAAIKSADLLVERNADITLRGGRKLSLTDFFVVDAQRLAKLDSELVVEWHRNGWLELLYAHLASLERFAELVARVYESEAVGCIQ